MGKDCFVAKLRLRIVTPIEEKVDEEVDMVIMRCESGDMGIQPGHEDRSAALDHGIARIFNDGEERRIAINSGIARVKDDVLTVIANEAVWPEDIDRAEVEAERDLAERQLKEAVDKLEIRRSQYALRRSLVHIEISSYPVIGGKH